MRLWALAGALQSGPDQITYLNGLGTNRWMHAVLAIRWHLASLLGGQARQALRAARTKQRG
jgi:hypothetical protein